MDHRRRKMHWKRKELLGKGSEALVFRGVTHKHKNPNIPSTIAVKTAESYKSVHLEREMRLLEEQFNDCPCIIRCLGSDITFENKKIFFNVFLEYAAGGSLKNLIAKKKSIPENLVKKYTKSILIALSYMHEQGYIHCDIKPHNILLFKNPEDDQLLAKLADFGLTKRIERGDESKIYGIFEGTTKYASPETIRTSEFGPKSDIWGLGCTVYEMLTNNLSDFVDEIHERQKVPEVIIRKNLSEEAKDFLEKCLVMNPKDRLSADALLQHPFILEEIKPASHHRRSCSRYCSILPHCFHIPNIKNIIPVASIFF